MKLLDALCLGHDKYLVGYTSGVFDNFHHGHANYLKMCREKCDFLILGVDTDELVQKKKGPERPFQSYAVRVAVIAQVGAANFIFRKECSYEDLAESLKVSKIFSPDNKIVSAERLHIMKKNGAEHVFIEYTKGVSTTLNFELGSAGGEGSQR